MTTAGAMTYAKYLFDCFHSYLSINPPIINITLVTLGGLVIQSANDLLDV